MRHTASSLRATHARLAGVVKRTPVLRSASLDAIAQCRVFFKCENMQTVGAFKYRGAANAVAQLPVNVRCVATHSSGNHAAALALAAQQRGIEAHIVMPRTAPRVKQEAVRAFGGHITLCEPTLDARESTLDKVLQDTGALAVHPYNNHDVIEGQSTACQELLEQVAVDSILVPIGGGGLGSGTCLAAHFFAPHVKVYGCEPEQADDAAQSFRSGRLIPSVNPDTVADGLRTSLGSLTFPILHSYAEDIVTVSEAAIIEAMRLCWTRLKVVIEPSCAVPFAALMEQRIPVQPTDRIGVILTGGNIDLDALPWLK